MQCIRFLFTTIHIGKILWKELKPFHLFTLENQSLPIYLDSGGLRILFDSWMCRFLNGMPHGNGFSEWWQHLIPMPRTFIRCWATDNYMANGFRITNCTARIRTTCIRWTTHHRQANLNGIQHVRWYTKYHRFIENGTAIRTFHAGLLFWHFFIILLQIYLYEKN